MRDPDLGNLPQPVLFDLQLEEAPPRTANWKPGVAVVSARQAACSERNAHAWEDSSEPSEAPACVKKVEKSCLHFTSSFRVCQTLLGRRRMEHNLLHQMGLPDCSATQTSTPSATNGELIMKSMAGTRQTAHPCLNRFVSTPELPLTHSISLQPLSAGNPGQGRNNCSSSPGSMASTSLRRSELIHSLSSSLLATGARE